MSEPNPNPLVAQETPEGRFIEGSGEPGGWATGIGIAESVNDVKSLNDESSWVEAGLAYGGMAMEAVSLAVDPIGTLLSYGVSWLIEHVQPLKEALDWFAGNPDGVQAYGQTWKNVSKAVGEAAKQYSDAVKGDTAQWTGAAGDAYRKQAAEKGEALTGAAELAGTISTVVTVMGAVVQFVREFVRDIVAECIAKLITYALEALCTFGLGTPVIVAQATAFISKTVSRIMEIVQKLTKTISNVAPKLAKMAEAFGDIMKALAKLGKAAGSKIAKGADKIDIGGKLGDKLAPKMWGKVDDTFGTNIVGKHDTKFGGGPDAPDGSGGGSDGGSGSGTSGGSGSNGSGSGSGSGSSGDGAGSGSGDGAGSGSDGSSSSDGGSGSGSGSSSSGDGGAGSGSGPDGNSSHSPNSDSSSISDGGSGSSSDGGSSTSRSGSGTDSGGSTSSGSHSGSGSGDSGGSHADSSSGGSSSSSSTDSGGSHSSSSSSSGSGGSDSSGGGSSSQSGDSSGSHSGGSSPDGGARPNSFSGDLSSSSSPDTGGSHSSASGSSSPDNGGSSGGASSTGAGTHGGGGTHTPSTFDRPSPSTPSSTTSSSVDAPTTHNPPTTTPPPNTPRVDQPATGTPTSGPTGSVSPNPSGGSPSPSGSTPRPGGGSGWTGTPGSRGAAGSPSAAPDGPPRPRSGPDGPSRPTGPDGRNTSGTGTPRTDAPGSRPDAPSQRATGPNGGPAQRADAGGPGTAKPDTTKAPDSTKNPDATKQPDGTKSPDASGQPDSKSPDSTGSPDRPKDGPDSQHEPDGADNPKDQPDSQHEPDGSKDGADKPHDPDADADKPEPGTPEYEQKINDGVDNLKETDNGGLSGHTDPNHQDLANRVPNDGKHTTVDAHMSPDGRIEIGGRRYSPDEFADVLRRSGWDGQSPIRLISCNSSDFAADLAKKLGVDVTTPKNNSLAWTDSQGRVFSTSRAPDGGPTWPPDGGWETHHPNGTSTSASDDAFHPTRHGEDPGERPDDAEARGDKERSRQASEHARQEAHEKRERAEQKLADAERKRDETKAALEDARQRKADAEERARRNPDDEDANKDQKKAAREERKLERDLEHDEKAVKRANAEIDGAISDDVRHSLGSERYPDEPVPTQAEMQYGNELDRISDDQITGRDSDGLISEVNGQRLEDYVDNVIEDRAALINRLTKPFDEGGADMPMSELGGSGGAANAVVVDRRHGFVAEGFNGKKTESVIPGEGGPDIETIHPQLRKHIEEMSADPAKSLDSARAEGMDQGGKVPDGHWPHPDWPHRHAEVKAVDSILKLREDAGFAINSQEDLQKVLDDLYVDARFPFKEPPDNIASCCPNCARIVSGPDSLPTNPDDLPDLSKGAKMGTGGLNAPKGDPRREIVEIANDGYRDALDQQGGN
jgi:hypothetical protein